MTELSALGVKITSSGVVKTTNELDAFAIASRKAAQANKPINVKATGINAKILNDVRALDKALAKASARAGIGVKVTGTAEAIASLNAVSAAAAKARAASNVNAKVTGGGGPSSSDVSAVNSLKGAVLGLVSAYTLLQGVKVYASLTDESKMLTAQLRLATSETGSFAKAQEDVRRIAAGTRADLDSTAALYGKLMLNSKQLGITQQEAARATETVAKAFKVSGASTVEAAQGTRQLVQALQSGVLRGDEFNTMAEAAPRLQKLLAESLGVTQGQLRKMAEEGELTSDKLTKAFTDKRFTQGLDDEFAQLPVTFGDAMTQIRNAAVITFGAFDEGGQFSKSITSFLIGGTKGMADWENAARSLGQTIAVEFAKITAFAESVTAGIRLFGDALIWVNSIPGVSTVTSWLGDVISQVSELASWLNPMNALFNIIGRVGEKAAQQKQRDLVADSQNSRINAMMGFKGNGQFRDDSPAITRNTAAVTKATKARKGLTDAERDAKRAADELKRAYDQKVKSADDYIASLTRENQEFGKTAKEIRLMEVARRMEAAATDEQRAAIQRLSDQREMNIDNKELEDARQLSLQRERDIQLIKDETEAQRKAGTERMAALRGLSGDALENELARINDEYEIQNILLRAQAAAANDAANAVHILAMANAEIAQVRQAQGQDGAERAFEQDRRRAVDTASQIGDIIGGKIGSSIGDLAKAMDKLAPELTAKIGDALGSGFGDAMGAFGAAVAANKAIGKIFGFKGGPLGIFTGLLTKTPKASASINAVAGEFMDTIVKGTKSKLKEAALTMANTIIDGLMQISDTLGAELSGNAKVSIGVRKGNYRVDPTGQGRTKGSGVVDFGKDEAAAIAFALQDAIRDGVLDGLSDSMKRLIMADGDFQAQLQKALSFKGVFDELAQKDDPAKWAQDAITKWHDGMAKIFKEAGATGDELAELERLTGIKRLAVAEDAAKAAQDKMRAQQELQLRIYELEGKADLARGISQQMELDGLGEVERAMQIRIYQLEQEAEFAERAAAIASERYGLEDRLFQLMGDTAKIREREMATINEANRPLLAHIYALEDQIAATQAATQAAEEAATAQKAIADERFGIEGRLLELNGDTMAIRARELAALDPTNRALMQLVYARQDEIAAAEEAAAKIKAIADERDGLQAAWLTAIGDEAALRARALAQLDPSNRALQQQIWAYEDAQKAAQAEIEMRNQQIEAIQSTSSALEQARDQYAGFAQTIREFKAGLFAPDAGAATYEQTKAQFQRTASMAALGDAGSLQGFTGSAQAFLDAAMNNASSLIDYQRAIGLVAGASDAAAAGADAVSNQAAQQLASIQEQVAQLQLLNEQTTQSALDLAKVEDVQANDVVPTLEQLLKEFQDAGDKSVQTRAEEKAEAIAIISNLSEQNAMLRQLIEDGALNVKVRNDAAEPALTREVPA